MKEKKEAMTFFCFWKVYLQAGDPHHYFKKKSVTEYSRLKSSFGFLAQSASLASSEIY